MIEINKTAIGIAAGLAGTLFLGYCIYFDNKNRNDPEYKKRLRERRNRMRSEQNTAIKDHMLDYNNHEQLEKYFLQEIQMGETLISRGEFEPGVEHLAKAIVICGKPTELLNLLQKTLPAQVFAMLVLKIQSMGNRPPRDEALDERSKMDFVILNASTVDAEQKSKDSLVNAD